METRTVAEIVLGLALGMNNLIEGGHISLVRWDRWQQVKAEAEKVVSDAD